MHRHLNIIFVVATNKVREQFPKYFYAFCNGRKDIYYLRLLLDQKPQLHATVKACLPDSCASHQMKPSHRQPRHQERAKMIVSQERGKMATSR